MKQKTCLVGPAQAQAIFAFEGVGVFSACEPNVNALCELKLGVQLKEKEKVYAASQMEDGSIKESSLEDFKTLSDFLRKILLIRALNAKYANLLVTVSTKDVKKKTYAVKDIKVMNDKELEFTLGPGPDPNVPFSNTAEEIECLVWYSRDSRDQIFNPFIQSNLLAPYVHSKIELGGFWRYNASEDTLDLWLNDLYYGTAGYADRINPAWYWELQYWLEKQIATEALVLITGIDSKGKEERMLRKVSGYKVEKGKMTFELSSKGLNAKSGDKVAFEVLNGFKRENYRIVGMRALSFAEGSFYSYSFPALPGIMKKGMDGKWRLAFKDGDKKALQYDKKTGVVSSMDASDLIEAWAQKKHEFFAQLQLKDSGKRYRVKLGEFKGVEKADGAWIWVTDVLDGFDMLVGGHFLDVLEGEEWKEVRIELLFPQFVPQDFPLDWMWRLPIEYLL
jgi:hypothetical protein